MKRREERKEEARVGREEGRGECVSKGRKEEGCEEEVSEGREKA